MKQQHNGRVVSFVRHAFPEVDSSVDPAECALSIAGTEAAKALELPRDALIVSSPERKALQTVSLAAEVAEVAVVVDPAFREVDRVETVHAGFREARRAWVSGALDKRHEGWELPEEAATRFADALLRFSAPHLVVGTHGMALTAWMVSCGVVDRGAPAVDFWDQLRFPEVMTVELTGAGGVLMVPERDGSFIAHSTQHHIGEK